MWAPQGHPKRDVRVGGPILQSDEIMGSWAGSHDCDMIGQKTTPNHES